MKTQQTTTAVLLVMVACFFTVCCVKLRETILLTPIDRNRTNDSPVIVDIRPAATSNAMTLPVTVQLDAQPSGELKVPITVVPEVSTPTSVSVSVKVTNTSSEQVVVPIKFQLESNPLVLPLNIAAAGNRTNSSVECGCSTRPSCSCPKPLAAILFLGIVSYFLFCQFRRHEPFENTVKGSNKVLENWDAEKAKYEENIRKEHNQKTYQRIFSTACACIAIVHFCASAGKADYVLLGLLV